MNNSNVHVKSHNFSFVSEHYANEHVDVTVICFILSQCAIVSLIESMKYHLK